ncbi:hypothetical protein ACA910_010756 [Epithemia clementina (nom. ined.)]
MASSSVIESKPDIDGDYFDFFGMKPEKKTNRSRKRQAKITISITSTVKKETTSKSHHHREIIRDRKDDDSAFQEHEPCDDWLEFFCDTHEDQDPAFIARQNKRREEELQKKISALDETDMAVRSEIDKVVEELLKEKQTAMERGIESYRERIRQEERKLSTRLQERYHERKASNEQKINQRVKQLQMEQQKQMDMTLQQHRQQVRQRRLPDAIAAQEWQMTSQRIQAKHQQQRQELQQRAEEYKRRTDVEYKQEQEKIKKMHEQKLADLETRRNDILSELIKQFTASRQRYLKRHLQRVMKEREQLSSQMKDNADTKVTPDPSNQDEGKSPREVARSAVESKQELRPPSPFKSVPDWIDQNQESTTGALARHKHRKGILSSAQTHSQLSIEIHNEGIWLLRLVNNPSGKAIKRASTPTSPTTTTPTGTSTQSPNNNNNNNNNSTEDTAQTTTANGETAIQPEFLPWGLRAFEFLESVVRGEVPMGFAAAGRRLVELEELGFMTQTSGQVFCSITDLRTGEETAQVQRSVALKEHEVSSIADLEKKATELAKLTADHEVSIARLEKEEKQCCTTVDAAIKDQDKAKKLTEDFTRRYRQYLGPDGRVLPTVPAKDREDMEGKLLRFKTNQAAADEKVKVAKEQLSEKKSKLQGLHLAVQNAQRNAALIANLVKRKKTVASSTTQSKGGKAKPPEGLDSERAASRVKDVIGCLEKVAEKRREQHNQKKSGHITSTWLHSHPDFPASFKKNVWRRMHRRKLQVVLRPSMAYLCDEVRSRVSSLATKCSSGEKFDDDFLTEKIIKAEKEFLLAYHPLAESPASSVPTSRSTEAWAEPGWRLDLSVPESTEHQNGILPRARIFPLLEKNLSEVCSAPGQQAASFLCTSHFRSLASPLSSFATMSSPAETPSVFEAKPKIDEIEGDPFYTTDAEVKLGYTFSTKTAAQKSATTVRKKSSVKDDSDKATSNKSNTASDKAANASSDRPEKKRRSQKSSDSSPRKRKKAESSTASNQSEQKQPPSAPHQSSRKPNPTQQQSRSKPSQVKTNQSGQGNFPSPHQQQQQKQQQQQQQQQQLQQQQMAQLRMMQQGRPAQMPQGPGAYQPAGNIQQMQQYYATLGHQNGPSPHAQQYHPSMSPNVAKMQGAGGSRPPVSMPIHRGMNMPGNGQQTVPMGGRPIGAPSPSNQSMAQMIGSATPQARNRSAQLNGPAVPNSTQRTQQSKQDGAGGPKQDPNDPLFMLK